MESINLLHKGELLLPTQSGHVWFGSRGTENLFFTPHRDADVLLDCGSPLEWNRTGMTEHVGGTLATA
jgi:hypothetical protein